MEVKGATKNFQHWVAVDRVEGNDIYIIDPSSNATILWNYYNWNFTSQFIYFKTG